ncbi:Uncharacterised protein [Yersinia pekkanenii]|uniref:Uncharacterized protein n=1 Tax=Yersinia pekkanenii TaxID=1288385 RepID=A0ABM9TZH2_9GAMM|nr:Uncharacterised protein [Yersinia pekkanenii]
MQLLNPLAPNGASCVPLTVNAPDSAPPVRGSAPTSEAPIEISAVPLNDLPAISRAVASFVAATAVPFAGNAPRLVSATALLATSFRF